MGKFEEYVKNLKETYNYKGSESRSCLTESSLSRLWQKVQEHDTGIVTAFRDTDFCDSGVTYSKSDNKKRNISLKANLLKLGYGLTKVSGVWVQNFGSPEAKELKEDAFFVEDLRDKGRLRKDLVILGERYDQDAILFINKGGNAELIGTNKCESGYPGWKKVVRLPKASFGKPNEFLTKVNNRPFFFNESGITPLGTFGNLRTRAHWSQLSEKHWSEMEIPED